MIFLDADVLIDLQRGFPPAIEWSRVTRFEEFALPGAVPIELLAGSRNRLELDHAARFIERFNVAWITEEDNRLALSLVERFCLQTGLGFPDFMIAAQAVNRQVTLFSFNLKHFRSIPGLDAQAPYRRLH